MRSFNTTAPANQHLATMQGYGAQLQVVNSFSIACSDGRSITVDARHQAKKRSLIEGVQIDKDTALVKQN
ncbi:hypothetical protein PM082_022414 [Marasmius tenuissimus]|nr:hypothetical protein PM082_022414 [Marasmius tenuissimus]